VSPRGTIGNLFFGGDGWMWVDKFGFSVYKGEKNERIMHAETTNRPLPTLLHMQNFLEACHSRNPKHLRTPIAAGAVSAALCHLANISYRVGSRKLNLDATGKRFLGDPEADKLITRNYRRPFVV
jgi:hypothetical protein